MRPLVLITAFLFPVPVLAAGGLSLQPVYATHSIGESFQVRVLADTGGDPISAAEGDIRFDPDALVVENISSEGSIITTFSTGPSFSNNDGRIRFAGWTGQPFTGSEGLLLTITFKSLINIVADVRFVSGSLLASDSRGSNVLERMGSALYAIQPREVTVVPPENAGEVAEGRATGIDAEGPPPPIFLDYESNQDAGDRLLVRGSTEPNGLVTLYISKDEAVTETSVVSGSDGGFTYVSDEGAEEGVYRISADVQSSLGLRSEKSDRIIITVRPATLGEAAAAALPFGGSMPSSVTLSILVLLGALATGYAVHRSAARKHTARHG